jgi:hypothetical protein
MGTDVPGELVHINSLRRPNAHVSTFLLCLRKGSLDEALEERGFLHFIEHLVFRFTPGPARYSPLEALERLGAFASARTTLDTTEFVLRIDPHRAREGLSQLCDMVFGRRFTAEGFALEKRVILEEVRLDSMSFAAQASREVISHLFGAGCSTQVTGSLDEVERLDLAPLESFYDRTYLAGDFVLAHVGPHDSAEVARVLEQRCCLGRPVANAPYREPPTMPRHVTLDAGGESGFMVLMAYRSLGYVEPGFSALQILCRVLSRTLAAAAGSVGASSIEFTLSPLRTHSIVDVLIRARLSDPREAATLSRAVHEILTGAPILASEVHRAARRVLLETCIEREEQDGLARQLLRAGMGRLPADFEGGVPAWEDTLSDTIEKVRAATFRNPISVSNY